MSSAILQADALAQILAERASQPIGAEVTPDSLHYLLMVDALSAEDIEVQKTLFEVFNLLRPRSALWEEPLRSRAYERMRKFDNSQ